MSFVKDNLEYYPYGLGDIVLFGNPKRMKIDEHFGLSKVFLESRVRILKECYAARTGWKSSLESMTCLLEDPEELYRIYSKIFEGKDSNHKNSMTMQTITVDEISRGDSHNLLTFDGFFRKAFNMYCERLMLYVPSLYTHLPTCFISLEIANNMKKVVDLLKKIQILTKVVFESDQELRKKLCDHKLGLVRSTCIEILKILQETFSLPKCSDLDSLCLLNTCLIFCTASSSAKLHTKGSKAIELLIIDEAAQLKECESTIPLQLPGLRHTVLVGDEKQLPAMVQSKISEKAKFGRSLFGRLALLGHPKHLLNTQYRMHPSISQFPCKEFYGGKIMDGQNVKLESYEKCFLEGKMFGPFSFINVYLSKVDQGIGFSR
jgi:senataxin